MFASAARLLLLLLAAMALAVHAFRSVALPRQYSRCWVRHLQMTAEEGSKKPAAPEPTINSLDLRVGVIRTVAKHETADKLYCEEIDVGEEEPREIASGLVPHYTLEEMKERRCVVVCNLKPRKLVGFKSHGMVLCASNVGADGEKEKVEFLDPPADAKPGDRIVGEGLDLIEPLKPNRCDKTKAFEKVSEELRVNAEGVGYWKEHRLICVSSGNGDDEAEPSVVGVCTTPTVRDGPVR